MCALLCLACPRCAHASYCSPWHCCPLQRHGPLRPANGGTGAAVEAAAEATAAAARAAGEKNELAEAWREDVDPAVAAHVVYRVFGEGVLPYLPGGALAGVLL